MVELMLDPTVSLEDLDSFSRAIVRSGLAIGEMNALRKHLSAVKGGRLAVAAAPATQCTLLISDVPAGRLHTIGSGPSLPDPSTTQGLPLYPVPHLRYGGPDLSSISRFFSNQPPRNCKAR